MGLGFALLGAVLALELHALGLRAWEGKSFWAFIAAGLAAAAVGGWGRPATLVKLFVVVCGCGLVEVLLQASAWLGILPAVNTKERLPWGRVYWTAEGLGNSIRNRQGWYFPEFDLSRTNRTAVIGDSFVEAVEVHRTRNLAAMLGGKLGAQEVSRTVLGLGNHGTGPAHYLEVLRYAHRRFAVQEAILVLYLGNDITDCSPRLQFHDPASFIYYTPGAAGELQLDATGEASRFRYAQTIDFSHRPSGLFLPRLAVSHCLLAQVPISVRNTLALRRKLAADLTHHAGFEAQTSRLGLKAEPFARQPSPAAREGLEIMEALLDRAAHFAESNAISLRLVTVPFFPQDFYATKGTNWNGQLGAYDFLAPERQLALWASRRRLPLLALGDEMKRRQLTTEQIRTLYLSNGSGHFSEAGHRLAAEAIAGAFYPPPRASVQLP